MGGGTGKMPGERRDALPDAAGTGRGAGSGWVLACPGRQGCRALRAVKSKGMSLNPEQACTGACAREGVKAGRG